LAWLLALPGVNRQPDDPPLSTAVRCQGAQIADSGLVGALDPGTASIAPVARFGMCGKLDRLTQASGL